MKNFTFTLVFAFAATFGAFAQDIVPANPVIDKVSTQLTRTMAEEMGLNEEDYIKIKTLNQERLVKSTEANKTYTDDEVLHNSILKSIEEEYEEKLFKMLNSRQVAAYNQFKVRPEANFTSLVKEAAGTKN